MPQFYSQTHPSLASNVPQPTYILCIDDEKTILDTLSAQIESHFGDQFYIEAAGSGEEALEIIEELMAEQLSVALVISDQLMPGMKGDEVLVRIHNLLPDTRKILLTGQAGADAVGRALNEAALYRYLTKPWDKRDLMMTIEEAVQSYLQNLQITEQNDVLESLYFASRQLSQEKGLDKLASRLVQVLVNATQAERGMLCLVDHNVVAETYNYVSSKESGNTEDRGSIYTGPMPELLLDALLTPKSDPILQEKKLAEIENDPYLKSYKPESIYPVLLENNGELLGILLLEDRKRKNAFQRGAQEFIQLFSAEAALSLDKALLYEQLEQRVEERTREVNEQKLIIEEKNTDITDSIRYASRIQRALAPRDHAFARHFANYSIFYRPKDIVSGDFIWYAQIGNRVAYAAADCTGHGVPGAMLSVLAHNLLDSVARSHPDDHPGQWLSLVNMELINKLGASEHESLDGMDIGVCVYDPQEQRLSFSGANRPLWFLRKGELKEVRSDKTSIGGHTPTDHAFEVHHENLEAGDRLFVFSDGIVDQFGGPQARKFTPARLRKLIMSQAQLPLSQFTELMELQFADWIGEGTQTDDVLLIATEIGARH